jgi:hypothetical protein
MDWQQTLRDRLARLPLERVRSQLDLDALEHAESHYMVKRHRSGHPWDQAETDAWQAYHDEIRSRVRQSCPQALPTSSVTWGKPYGKGSGMQRPRRIAWSFRDSQLGEFFHQLRVAGRWLRFRVGPLT